MIIQPRNLKGYYTIDNEPYISVTTALQIIYKKGLDIWKQKKVAETALLEPNSSIDQILKDANKTKNAAASKGRKTHKAIELSRDLIKISEHPIEIQPYLIAYNKFLESMRFGIIARELTCYSQTYKFAGTADLLIQTFFGETWLIDFKTSNYVHDSNQLQLSAYKEAIEEMKIIKIDRLFILHLMKDKNFDLYEAKYDFETFKAVLKLNKWADPKNIKLLKSNDNSKKELNISKN